MRLLTIGFLALALPAAAAVPVTTQDLLLRVGRSTESFWKKLQAVTCVETVEQTKLGLDGKVVYRQQTVFDYLTVIQVTVDDLMFDESREMVSPPNTKKTAEDSNVALLITNGFPAFEFIFHPLYQGSFEYSAPESVEVEGRRLMLVRFRHIRGARSPSVLKLKSRAYPLEWQGSAWLNPETFEIERISASLLDSMADIGLTALTADVRYALVRFSDDPRSHLLPAVARIEAETLHQHWRNTHTFAKYRQFTVDVKTEMEAPR
jgi:hypothetical protein